MKTKKNTTAETYVYWTVHHFYSCRLKDQLDVTCYFISLLMYPTCFGHRYIHHQELLTILLNYHIGRFVLGSLCVGDLVWMGWSGIGVVSIYSKLTALNLQHTSNQEQHDQCGNSAE